MMLNLLLYKKKKSINGVSFPGLLCKDIDHAKKILNEYYQDEIVYFPVAERIEIENNQSDFSAVDEYAEDEEDEIFRRLEIVYRKSDNRVIAVSEPPEWPARNISILSMLLIRFILSLSVYITSLYRLICMLIMGTRRPYQDQHWGFLENMHVLSVELTLLLFFPCIHVRYIQEPLPDEKPVNVLLNNYFTELIIYYRYDTFKVYKIII